MKQIERKDYMNTLIGLRDKNGSADFNRRILLTTDVEPMTNYKGIQKINVIDWLLEEEY